jgi:hypothetical protein
MNTNRNVKGRNRELLRYPESTVVHRRRQRQETERLNCIEHILSKIPYEDVPSEKIALPERVFNPDYERRTLPDELYVPKIY